ncbi:DNA/RNA polymerase [Violaceomyces palustris]|uniref:DNA/RNA polymerase n=1 Tax=Violaceomyces palustris TaxID=1673888 RepID=A0ACD0NSI9_9BASI|nr:DNA/RNA polymerase [Violaceomyces palustris]
MNFFRDRDSDSTAYLDPSKDPSSSSYNLLYSASRSSHSPSSPSICGKGQEEGQEIQLKYPSSPTCDSSAPSHRRDVDEDQDEALKSLKRRMAGPSSAKAGLANDQEEINRKIYEVSKGSKFFENEKKKDEQVTRRIHSILAKRDEKLKMVKRGGPEWSALESKIDEMAEKLETSRDLSRLILHLDMDMFYAAVELQRDPSLQGKCFGVGRSVLVTCSYEARKYGVRSGMAGFVAKALCPDLIFVENNMSDYVSASKEVMAVFSRYDDNLAQASLDEAYLDVTHYCEETGISVEDLVARIRREVKEETKLTVSVGIAPNTTLAKICSDKNKPDGQYRIPPDRRAIVDFMRHLPCRKIPGIGRVNERVLESLGVKTCGDIWERRVELHLTLGNIEWLLKAHLGLGSTVVEPGKREERKSVGREQTFSPTSDQAQLHALLKKSAEQVEQDLASLDFKGRTVTLVAKRDTYQRFSRARTLTRLVNKSEDLYEVTASLLSAEIEREAPEPLRLRLIGVRVSHLFDLRVANIEGERLKRMFVQASNQSGSPSKRMRKSEQPYYGVAEREFDLGENQEEEEEVEEEKQLAEAIRRSLEDGDPFHAIRDLSQPSRDQDDSLQERQRFESELAKDDQGVTPDSIFQTQVRDPAPLKETHPARSSSPSGGKDPCMESRASFSATPSSFQSPKCPICSRPVPGGNLELNNHLDRCLTGQADKSVDGTTTEKEGGRAKRVKKRKGPLDGFFFGAQK